MPEKNFYELLRVPRGATQDELDAQYHELLYQYHPDRNPGEEDKYVDRTVALVTAYRTLSDASERKKYDFKVANPLIEDAQTKGVKLLKSKEKKEAEQRFSEGVTFFKAGDMTRSAEAFKAAVKLEGEFPEAWYNLSLIGALLLNQNFAADALARGLKSSPADSSLARLRKGIQTLFFQS